MDSLVSVLIPCYNAQKFVRQAVDSALAQTYPHVEVIVVDDGSTDGSPRVLESFGERIRWNGSPNRGACAARNRALELSRGEYIQFLDADDYLLPDKFARQIAYLRDDKADLVFCRGLLEREGQAPVAKKRPIASPSGTDPFVYCLGQGLATEGPLHRRRCLERVGGFRPGLERAQEFDLHARLAATNVRLQLVDECLYVHRDHDGPRITRKLQPADHMVRLLMELADLLEADLRYEFTPARRQALAGCLFQHAIYSFRKGQRDSASLGFQRARVLSRDFEYQERGWYKRAARWLGPMSVERILALGRSLRFS